VPAGDLSAANWAIAKMPAPLPDKMGPLDAGALRQSASPKSRTTILYIALTASQKDGLGPICQIVATEEH